MQLKKSDYYFNLIKGIFLATIRKIIGRKRFKRRVYNGKRILKNIDANELIRKNIEKGSPFLVARFGDGELRTTIYYLNRQLSSKRKEYPQYIKNAICKNAGFFPDSENMIDRFGQVMIESCKKVDILAVWFNLLEDYVYRRFGPSDGQCIYLKALEPFWFEKPWSSALKGKKVLVVHPFADTIQAQYKKREKLFKDPDVLPNFELISLKAVQSIGGECKDFSTWFEALEWMYQEAMKKDFDIAIVGCGAYGLPLAAKIRSAGKMVIHMGGATQLLFGIKGARWDVRPDYVSLYNEAWCRPGIGETPKTASQVEGGCYW